MYFPSKNEYICGCFGEEMLVNPYDITKSIRSSVTLCKILAHQSGREHKLLPITEIAPWRLFFFIQCKNISFFVYQQWKFFSRRKFFLFFVTLVFFFLVQPVIWPGLRTDCIVLYWSLNSCRYLKIICLLNSRRKMLKQKKKRNTTHELSS